MTRRDPPTLDDFKSYEGLGRSKPHRERDVASWRGVSTFDNLDLAREKAKALDLGEFVAELDVPATVKMTPNSRGHVDVHGTTPSELKGYVIQIHPVEVK